VCPPSTLHAVPWGLLPALSTRPVSMVPSADLWLRATRSAGTRRGGTVLIGGPKLPAGGREILGVAGRRPDAVVLRDGSATVDRCLSTMDGASLVHIVAHGSFRSDSPMFSSLLLDDGPLTVHDLERLSVAPDRVILSACDSGVMAPVGASALIGLASAMLSIGTRGLVSSVAEINDTATVAVMLDVHAALLDGEGLAEALLAARSAAEDDPLRAATAATFVAVGV